MADSTPTAPPPVSRPRLRRARSIRRAFFVFVTAIVVAGILGWFGPLSGVTSASGGGYDVEVEYARISRSGLAATLTVTIRATAGFESPLTLAFASAYFDSVDVNGVDPEPLASTSTADREIGLFQPPPDGDEMVVSYDARFQPGAGPGWVRGSVAILRDERDVVTVPFSTWLWP